MALDGGLQLSIFARCETTRKDKVVVVIDYLYTLSSLEATYVSLADGGAFPPGSRYHCRFLLELE